MQELPALFHFILFADGFDIHVAQPLNLLAQFLDLIGDAFPIHFARIVRLAIRRQFRVFRRQIQLRFFHRPLDERFDPDANFAGLEFQVVDFLIDLFALLPRVLHGGRKLPDEFPRRGDLPRQIRGFPLIRRDVLRERFLLVRRRLFLHQNVLAPRSDRRSGALHPVDLLFQFRLRRRLPLYGLAKRKLFLFNLPEMYAQARQFLAQAR